MIIRKCLPIPKVSLSSGHLYKTLMLRHGGSSAGSYLADPTSPIPSHCAVIILFQSVPVHVGTSIIGQGIAMALHNKYVMLLDIVIAFCVIPS